MILVDTDILNLVNVQPPALGLIDPFDRTKLSNCRYDLWAEKVFLPKSGDEQVIGSRRMGRRMNWSIKPSETLIIMTKDSINMPDNLFASYSQLNRLARQGILLINVSIVEPGYHGPLSCFIANFSRETVHLYPDDSVAKITFYQLTAAPANLAPVTISPDKYKRDLAKAAQLYPVSLMDIGGLEERVTDRVSKGVTHSIKLGVGLLAVLAFWTTLEPVTNKFLWERIGVLSSTQRQEIMQLRQELERTKNELAKASDDIKAERKIADLEEKIKTQAQQIEQLQRFYKVR